MIESQENLGILELGKAKERAQQYLSSAQPDSAMLVLQAPLQYLKKTKQLNSLLGLELQYIQAQSLEVDQQDSLAVEALLGLKTVSWGLKSWNIYSKTCLALANLHEKLEHSQQSKINLEDARAIIDRFALDSVRTSFAIRISSWHRFYGNRDSAQYYAQLALTSARRIGDISGEAQGHLLLGAFSANKDYLNAIEHYKEAARLCELIHDYLGQTWYNNGIASLFLKNNQPEKALPYNTISLLGVKNAVSVGYDENWMGYHPYQLRGKIFQALGRMDSAFYYLQKGMQMELKNLSNTQKKEVAKIDAQYNDEKKNLQLAQQHKAIQQERQIKYLLIGVVFSVLVIALVLIYSYLKQRRINDQIKEQAKKLEELDQMKTRFFANVSHELRTPLTLLTSPIQTLLKEKQLSEKQTQLLQMADRSGKQLGQLINEILDLRKLEMGKMTITPEPTELCAYFQTYFAQFESLAEQKQIDYQVVVAVPDKAIADLDREKCRQILFNLLSNAFKFTPQGGRIEAKVQAQEQTLELQITNSGTGIHPDDLPHIFDRYFQTNRPDKPVEGGTGIGLALCREYAQLFGGSIHAASTPGANTVFRVAFPLQHAEVKAEDVTIPKDNAYLASRSDVETTPFASPATPQSTDNKPTLLVVEDNPDLCAYIRMILQDKYRVIAAEHGQAAWEMIDKNGKDEKSATPLIPHPSFLIPDLILSDLMMPVMDGYQLLERLKSDDATRHIPVVMLTARAEAQDKLTALRIGVDDYLTKPFDEEELLVRIENLLKNYAARRAANAPDNNMLTCEAAAAPLMSQPDREWLESFEVYVQKHFSSDLLSVSSLAYEFAMSESTLLRQLKRLTGLSPIQYIQEIRLNEARRLLENRTYNSIAQVAAKVGYDDARTFTRSFKQRFGKVPSIVLEA